MISMMMTMMMMMLILIISARPAASCRCSLPLLHKDVRPGSRMRPFQKPKNPGQQMMGVSEN